MRTSMPSPLAAVALRSAFGTLLPLVFAAGAWATGTRDNVTITVVSDPATVSVSRVGGPTFRVSYQVTVKNNSSNNNYTYDFKGTTAVSGATGAAAIARFDRSSGLPCTVVSAADKPTVVECTQLKVDKNTSKKFSVTFFTPQAGTKLRFTVKSTSSASRGEGYADTPLITQPAVDINLGFETFVTEDGGLFYTGSVGNGCGPIPGSWPSASDPFTTSLYVPPINFTTTAKVYEPPPDGQSCSPLYTADGCFQSDLSIPSAPGAFQSLKIYLRIGPNKIVPGSNIANAVLKYTKDATHPEIDLQSCAQTGGPTSGNPCIASRRAYGSNYPVPSPSTCNGVWEFLVEAVDNGRFSIR